MVIMHNRWANIIATDPATGDAYMSELFGGQVDRSFSAGTKLYPAGTTFTPGAGMFDHPAASAPSTARFASTPMTQDLELASLALAADARYVGVVLVEAGDRVDLEGHHEAFIAASGYTTP